MQDNHQKRYFVVQMFGGGLLLLLLFRCFYLQVMENEYSNLGYQKPITIYPARGLFMDRNGKQLVRNEATYDIMLTYALMEKNKIDTSKLCDLLGITKDFFIENVKKDFKGDNRFSKRKPFIFLKNVSFPVYHRFAEAMYEFPGFSAEIRNIRAYDVNYAAHALGYISEVTQSTIDKSGGVYVKGDYAGASGLEAFYEPYLRGEKGVQNVLTDNHGRERGKYKNGQYDKSATSGLYLVSTLDSELQKYGELLMKNKKGSIVAIEPKTGEILSLISSPTYDPNLLTANRDRAKSFRDLNGNDTLKPLLNRAITSKYPPGSIFKIVMALIGLQKGVLYPERGIGCRRGYYYGRRRLGCHGHPYCGTPMSAIQHSCNAYFCQTFRELVDIHGYQNPGQGLDETVEFIKAFGLGQKMGIDMMGESAGNIPTSKFYDKLYSKVGWGAPTIISMGIGQGEVQATPLQMANIAAIVANKGYFYTPHLCKEFKASQDIIDKNFVKRMNDEALSKYKIKHQTPIDTQHFRMVIDGMERVVSAGTARKAYIPGLPICGKTGTAEDKPRKDHSVFIAFAPKEDPKIAIAVFVENSGFGGTYAAPIASLMIEKYIRGTISKRRLGVERKMTSANLLGIPRPKNTLQAPPTLQNGQAIIVPTVPINQPKGTGIKATIPVTIALGKGGAIITVLGKGVAKTGTNTSVTPPAKVKAINKPLPSPVVPPPAPTTPPAPPAETPIIQPSTDGQ